MEYDGVSFPLPREWKLKARRGAPPQKICYLNTASSLSVLKLSEYHAQAMLSLCNCKAKPIFTFNTIPDTNLCSNEQNLNAERKHIGTQLRCLSERKSGMSGYEDCFVMPYTLKLIIFRGEALWKRNNRISMDLLVRWKNGTIH